jgi:hypothetical protein
LTASINPARYVADAGCAKIPSLARSFIALKRIHSLSPFKIKPAIIKIVLPFRPL